MNFLISRYEKLWNVLADLLKELQKSGLITPKEIIGDLKSAKTLIEILKIDSKNTENILSLEKYLRMVESYLILVAQEKLTKKSVRLWMEKIERSGHVSTIEKTKKSPLKFFPGLPRGEPWLRIQISEELSRKKIEKIAKKMSLSHKLGSDNWILVFGQKKNLDNFVKEIKKIVKR